MALVAWHATVLRWPAVVGLLLSVMLFVPIGRYSIPINLPFDLELYRLAVAIVLAAWVGSLLVDPRVQLRRSPFQASLLIILCATFGSIVVNAGRVMPLGSAVLKATTFFLSFVLVHYFILSVVRNRRTIENVTKLLVSGTAAVAAFAIVEQRTQFNIFDHVGQVLPFLQFNGAYRSGPFRAHPRGRIVGASNRAGRGARDGASAWDSLSASVLAAAGGSQQPSLRSASCRQPHARRSSCSSRPDSSYCGYGRAKSSACFLSSSR